MAALVRRVSGMLLQPYRSSSSTVVDGQPQQRQQARPVVVVDTTSAAAAAVAGVTPLPPVFDDSAVTAALIALRRDLSVHLCVANKGGAMVVWSRPSYVTAGVVHLCSPTSPESRNYRLLSGRMECLILVDSAVAERFRLVERLVGEGNITTHEWRTMNAHPSRPSPIRFRPKVHKPADAESGTFTARPIVSTTRSVSRPIPLRHRHATDGQNTLQLQQHGRRVETSARLQRLVQRCVL